MNFNDEVDWPERFQGHISRPSLANPKNKRRKAYIATMVFLEAAAREMDAQLCGRSRRGREDLGWARLTRQIVVQSAKSIAKKEISELDRQGLGLGEGAFRDRWPGLGGMSDFLTCLVRYLCTAPQWCRIFDYGPRKALAELSRTELGELGVAELIFRIAVHDLKIRVRLARCWLFPLSLTMDAKWKPVVGGACTELLEEYIDHWVKVYEEGLKQFQVRLRPNDSVKQLAARIAAIISGYAGIIAVAEDESYLYGQNGFEQFAVSVQSEIYAAIDPGDGFVVGRALDALIRRQYGS